MPALSGQYIFGDFSAPDTGTGRLFYSDFSGGLIQELRIGDPERDLGIFLKGFGQDDNGDVYALGDGNGDGFVYKIVSIPAVPTILNLSTRLNVGTGDNVLIGGFIVTGSDNEEVVLRGIGPSLPLAGSLPNPRLELHDSTGALIASNDNWMDSPQKDEIISRSLAPNDDLESALLVGTRARQLHHHPERRGWRHRHRPGGTLRNQSRSGRQSSQHLNPRLCPDRR